MANKPEVKKKCLIKRHDVLIGETGNYEAVEVLSTRGFNEVYKVSSTNNPEKKYALKAEMHKAPSGKDHNLRLKIETHLLSEITKVKKESGGMRGGKRIDTSRFINMIDKGSTPLFKYYVMDLIWLPLTDVFAKVLNYKLSPHAKINIARQSLASIEALHDMGYLHRNISTASFSIGLPPNDTVLYLMNFGIAKYFKDKNGKVKVPRTRVYNVRTLKYASLASLEDKELSRRDDLEGWLYVMMELYDRKNIMWRNAESSQMKEVIYVRKRLFDYPQHLKEMGKFHMPNGYYPIITMIGAMTYYDAADFKRIDDHLSIVAREDKADMTLQLDWIGKKIRERPKKTEKGEKKGNLGKNDNGKNQPSNEKSDEEDEETLVSDFDRKTSEYEDFQKWRKEKKQREEQQKKAGDRAKEMKPADKEDEKEPKTAADRTLVDKTVDVTIDGDVKPKKQKKEKGKKTDDMSKTLKLGYAETVLVKK